MAKKAKEVVKKEKKDPRKDALRKVILAGNKLFGEGTMFTGGEAPRMDIEAISTGSLSLDYAIGVGGLPQGRIIEIFGPEASGKTMISLSTIAQAQKAGKMAAFIDAEHALTPKWTRSLGVDFDNLLLTQPDSGEKALSIMKYFVEQNVDIVVLDSVAALVTKREIEGEMDANHMALTARLMSLALKKLTPIISKSRTCCIFINQIRDNVGVMYGAKEITPGGKALKFYSSVRLKASKAYKSEKFTGTGDQKRQIGHGVQVKVVKNKVAAPFREAQFDLYYNSGIDWKSELFKIGVEQGVIDRPSKTKYSYGEFEWVGKDNAAEAITKDEELATKIRDEIAEALLKGDNEEPDTIIEKDGKIIDTETGDEEEVITIEDVDTEFDV